MNTVIELTVARLKPAITHLGLSVVNIDPPFYSDYKKQWDVSDVDGLVYATIGVLPNDHDVVFASDYTLRGVGEISRLSTRDRVDKAIGEAYNLASNPPSKLVELENEYLALEIEEGLLRNRIEETAKQIERDKKRLKEVAGVYRDDWSLKRSKQAEIDKEKTRIENDSLVRPVFTVYPQFEEDYRLLKVTPKCVFLRRVKGSGEIRVLKDGSNLDCYSLGARGFDLEATIKRFDEAKKND